MRSSAATAAGHEVYPPRSQAWLTVVMLAGLYFMSYADRLVLGLLAIPIQKDLGIGDSQFGLLIGTTFAIFYTIFGLVLAPFVDRRNRKRLIAAGALIWTVTTTLSAFAHSFGELMLLRLGVSIGEAVLSPAAVSMIADLFPRDKRAAPTSFYNAFAMVGSTGAFLYAAFLYELASTTPLSLPVVGALSPWRSSLFLIGFPGVLLVLVFLMIVREPARQVAADALIRPSSLRANLATHWRLYVGFLGGLSILAFASISVFTWYPTVLVRSFGIGIAAAGSLFGTVGLVCMPVGALATPFLIWLFNRHFGRDRLVALAITVMSTLAICMILTLTVPTLTASIVFLAPTMLLMGTCNSIGFIGIQQIVEPQLRGRIVAVYLTMYSIFGLGMGPFFIGLMSEHLFGGPRGLGYALAASAFVTTVMGAFLMLLARRQVAAALN